MKRFIYFALILFYCNPLFAQQNPNKVEIKIKTSAVCEMCKTTLEKAMAYERGVLHSNLDVTSSILTIEYNSKKTTLEKIKKAITETGYDADDEKANQRAYDKLKACCKKGGHSN